MTKRLNIVAAAGVAALGLALSSTASAATLVLFSDFDAITSPDFATQGYTIIPFADGWTAGDGANDDGIEIQNNNVAGLPFSAPNLVELDTNRNSSMFVNLSAGKYVVSYYYSPRPNRALGDNGITLSIGATQLDTVDAGGLGQTAWTLRTTNAFTTSGARLTFAAVGTSNSYGGYLDNITITAVPEPGTWALMIGGFGGAGAMLRRNRRRAVAA